MRILVVEPGKKPYESDIEDDYKEMQKIVGGLIEAVYPFDVENNGTSAVLFCNEEGKLIGLEGNRHVGEHIIAGTFFIVGDSHDGDCCSLTDEQVTKYAEMFAEPEIIDEEEVQQDNYMTFMSW